MITSAATEITNNSFATLKPGVLPSINTYTEVKKEMGHKTEKMWVHDACIVTVPFGKICYVSILNNKPI